MSEASSTPVSSPAVVATQITCPNCSYNLTGVAIGSSCPECGLVIGRGALGATGMPMSGKAIASLVLGIVAIVGCSMYGVLSLPCGIIAIVLGRKVKDQIVRADVSPSSAGMAKAGIICGIIGLSMGSLMVLFMIFIIFAGFR